MTQPSDIKAILFDKDGTIFGFTATWSSPVKKFLLEFAAGDQLLAERMGQAIGYEINSGLFTPGSIFVAGSVAEIASTLSTFVPHLHTGEIEAQINQASILARPQLAVADTVSLFDWLSSRNYAIGLTTNDSERSAKEQLCHAAIDKYFNFICGYDSGYGGKPNPGSLIAFSQQVDVSLSKIAVIGDSAQDMQMARSQGSKAVAVLTGPATRSELTPFADLVLADISQLPDWLTGKDTDNGK